MKRYTIVLIALLAALPMWAQNVSLGLKGGVNLATIGGDVSGVESRLGLHVGGYAQVGISDRFSIQPEVLYSTQGAQSARFSEVKINLNYVTIPILAKVYFTEGFSGHIGPQIGILTNAAVSDNEGSDNVIDEYKKGDIGLAFGLGYELDSGLNFSGRYNFGISNIDNVVNNAAEYIERNQVLQFSVGYTLK